MTARPKYGRIRNARQNAAPLRAFALVLVLGVIMQISLAGSVHDMQRLSCDGVRYYLAGAEQTYQRKYGHFVVGNENALKELIITRTMRTLPLCRAGGHYEAVANMDGSITIHCSLPEHDKDHGVTRAPWRHRH